MEGAYWRLVDPRSGRVVIALCGACRRPAGPWALVAAAAHVPGRAPTVAWTLTDGEAVGAAGPAVKAGGALVADAGRLRVRLDGLQIEVAIAPVHPWPAARPFGALGPAHLVPGLGQYWHPHLPAGRATGSVTLAGERVVVDGWDAYAEKNWGSRFAGDWWWGQAGGLGADADAAVAFAGGRLHGGAPTALVVALPDGVGPLAPGGILRFGPPLATMRTAVAPGRWRVQARGPVHAVTVEAEADPATAVVLPVPVPGARDVDLRSRQHLAGHLRVEVRRGRRILLRAETDRAGLELGTA